jgi:RimJ/RimL family protein N-acetyltransferase
MANIAAIPGPTIETERLVLRPPVAEDFEGFCRFHNDPKTMEFLGGLQPPSVVWRTMRAGVGSWHLDGFHFFSVLEKETGDWIGRIGPIYPHQWPGREIGWGLCSSHWGRGYAKEAAIAAMNYAFDELRWERVIHAIAPENERSAAVAMALGSSNLGPGKLPEPFAALPIEIWGQSREAWQANKRTAQIRNRSR